EGFLVAWADYSDPTDPANGNIRAARVDAGGALLGGGPVTLSDAPGMQLEPHAATLGQTALVVWTDERDAATPGGADIYGTRVSAAGTVLDPAGILMSLAAPATPTPGRQSAPAIAASATGFLVAWKDERSAPEGDIYATRIDPAGHVLNPGGIPLCLLDGIQAHPAVASDGTGFLVAWEDRRNGGQDIYATRLDASGGVLEGDAFPLSLASLNQLLPSLCFGGGNYLAAWEDNRSGLFRDIYAARVTPAGGVLEPDGILVTLSESQQHLPGMAWNGEVYLLAWREFRRTDGFDLYGTRLTTGGSILDPDGILISSQASFNSYAAIAASGNDFLVAWEDQRPGKDHNLLGRRVGGDGTLLDSRELPLCTDPSDQFRASVVGTGTGWFVAWADNRNDPDFDLFGAVVSQSGRITTPANGIPISTGPGLQFSVRLAYNGDRILAVWRDTRNVPSDNPDLGNRQCDVYGRMLLPNGTLLGSADFPICTVHQAGRRYPSVATDGTSFMVAWEDGRGGDLNIYGTLVLSTGEVAIPDGQPICQSAGQQSIPCVTWDGGNYLVLWRDTRTGTPAIFGRQVSPSGSPLGDPEGFIVSGSAQGEDVPWAVGAGQQISMMVYQTRLPDQLGRIGIRVANGTGHRPPAFTSTPGTTASAGGLYQYEIRVASPDTPTPGITGLQLPGWLTLTDHGDGTATLRGIPQAGDAGTNRVILLVSDNTLSIAQLFDIVVAPNPMIPQVTSAPVVTATEGATYSYPIAASDPGGQPIRIRATTVPPWLGLTDNGNGTGTLSGTPSSADIGTHAVVLEISDGTYTLVQSFSITVAPASFPPEFVTDPVLEGTKGEPYAYNIQTKGSPGKPLTLTAPT
ncbi:MAG TPA: hypothetical protein DCM86_13225, partial [Verrucomicrobiales bacterium]|nr:hypothetical protein [Verrucomicrobiales bacterium]